ncbi:MAG: MoxR-like ATPase [Promethearchaeota archaeon]|jgi:nitric oxide reductase NorQ protein|nr:MAG: MoxR-like ATPase [Candidatus Lokiarchaeota archaeon]
MAKSEITEFSKLIDESKIEDIREEINLVLEGQYKYAYEAMMDAYNAGLFVGLVGPVGCGKTALCRKFAYDMNREFHWVTFSDLVRPSTLIGSFDPTLVFKFGFSPDSYIPGPFSLAALKGGIFLANELNRGDEYVLNSMLDAMEERRLYIPQLKTWLRAKDEFYVIAAMNPTELKGTRKLPSAIKDRIKVWIHLGYPPKSLEQKIMVSNCPEYNLSALTQEKIIELMVQCRNDPVVERPPSLRTSIGLARFVSQRAQRLNTKVDNKLIAESARLILQDSLELRPGRNIDQFIKKILTKVVGVS